MITIRPSILPGFVDCERRAAARYFTTELKEVGFELRSTVNKIGPTVGTAVHAGAEYTLATLQATGELGNRTEAEQRGIDALDKAAAEAPIDYDGTTRQRSDAQRQIARMIDVYRREVAPPIKPRLVERRMRATWSADVVLSGQLDLLAADPGAIRDIKTGVSSRPNQAQYGAYAIIADANGLPVDRIIEDFIKRVRVDKEQPSVDSREFDFATATAAAEATIDRVVDAVRAFRGRAQTGHAAPEWAFAANPQSMLCSDRWCPAWGTKFCREHAK